MKKVFLMLMFSGIVSMTTVNAQAYCKAERGLQNRTERSDEFQRGGDCMIPGLTSEQQESIDKLRTAHLKKTNQLRATMDEKRSRLKSLRVADNYDEKEINKTIDEIAGIKADLMKERESHQRDVRALLTDDQKAWFDSRPMERRGDRMHRGGNGRGFRGDF
jgi:Spy/CpxP family protein refolding chaperone